MDRRAEWIEEWHRKHIKNKDFKDNASRLQAQCVFTHYFSGSILQVKI